MSKAKHTPAPWEVEIPKESNGYVNIKMGYKSACVYGDVVETLGHPSEESVATARLIAEAPSMYQLLKRVVNEIDWSYETWHGHGGQEFRDEIDELIKEIEG